MGKRERMVRYSSSTISLRLAARIEDRLQSGPCSSLRWMWLELSMCSHWAGTGLLSRSFSRPVARAERPNNARKGLVMLPSAIAIGGLVLGNIGEWLRNRAGVKVGGSGDLVDRVDQHLGVQPAERVTGEVGRGLAASLSRGIEES